jgi:predicted nucleic acid-binding protein
MRRRLKLYLDTSVFGSLFDFDDPRRIEITKNLLEEVKKVTFEAFISPLVVAEISKAPEDVKDGLISTIGELELPLLTETEEAAKLAQDYIQEGIIPQRFRDDARHIAIPVVYNLDALISWNYKHMVNLKVKRMVNAINLRLGYKLIEILSPEEVVGYGEMES